MISEIGKTKTLDFVGDSKNAPKIHNSGENTLRMGAILHLAQEYINVVEKIYSMDSVEVAEVWKIPVQTATKIKDSRQLSEHDDYSLIYQLIKKFNKSIKSISKGQKADHQRGEGLKHASAENE